MSFKEVLDGTVYFAPVSTYFKHH